MLHLERFAGYLTAACGHDRLSPVAPRDVSGWRDHLAGGLGPSTVNHHRAPVSGFLAWVVAQGCGGLQVLDSHLDTVRRRLLDAAAHLTGAKVLAARLYGVGLITALALTCWLGGGGGRFSSARKAVRFAGLDVTVYSSAGKRSPSISDPVRGQPPRSAEAYPVACWPDDKIVEFPGRRSGLAVHLR